MVQIQLAYRLIRYVNNCRFGLGYDNDNIYAPSSREQPALPIPDANYADPWTLQSAQVSLLQAAVTALGYLKFTFVINLMNKLMCICTAYCFKKLSLRQWNNQEIHLWKIKRDKYTWGHINIVFSLLLFMWRRSGSPLYTQDTAGYDLEAFLASSSYGETFLIDGQCKYLYGTNSVICNVSKE